MLRRHRAFAPVLWIVLVLIALLSCDLPNVPSTTIPVATTVVVVETPDALVATASAMRLRGCVLTQLEPSPDALGLWAVFSCVSVPMQGEPVQPSIEGLPR